MWEIVVETVTPLRYRYSCWGAMTFAGAVLPRLNVVHLGPDERARAFHWFRKLSRDARVSFCDAASHTVIAERLSSLPCLAFDDAFRRTGLTVLADLL